MVGVLKRILDLRCPSLGLALHRLSALARGGFGVVGDGECGRPHKSL